MAHISAEELARLLPDPNAEPPGQHRDLVVIGASAGGVGALSTLVGQLPRELPAAVLVTLHIMPTGTSFLPAILGRSGAMSCSSAGHGERLERGHIYVAPPDRHLLVANGEVELSHGPRENGHRPGIDPMFRSAARHYGKRVIGVVLSGTLDDGTAGMRLIKEQGGTTIVQDPEDALYPGMPRSVIEHGQADVILPIAELGKYICSLIETPVAGPVAAGDNPGHSDPPPMLTLDLADDRDARAGDSTGLTCPECGGALWAHDEGGLLRFRCHVGHAYSPESMQVEQGRALESALWTAVRSLEEQADLLTRVAGRSRGGATRRRFEARAADATRHANVLRDTIADLGRALPAGEAEDPAA